MGLARRDTTRQGGSTWRGALLGFVLLASAATVVTTGVAPAPASAAPVRVEALSASQFTTCAITAIGRVRCWGSNSFGQLGDGTTAPSATPVEVVGLTDVEMVAAGSAGACAVDEAGDAWCWGRGAMLGDGIGNDSSVPVQVVGLTEPVVSIAVSEVWPRACAVTSDGVVSCWGHQSTGAPPPAALVPSAVSGLPSGAETVSFGSDHVCALLEDGSVRCWGSNAAGQLGNGTLTSSTTPVVAANLSGVVAIEAGSQSSCAVRASGTVACWGDAEGTGGAGNGRSPTSLVGIARPVVAVATNFGQVCAVDDAGALWCAGTSALSGQIGPIGGSATMVPVRGLPPLVDVAMGATHTCVLTQLGAVRCFGRSAHGALGSPELDTTMTAGAPIQIPSSGIAAVDSGARHRCALSVEGGVSCWGSNVHRRLGTASSANEVWIELQGVVNLGTGMRGLTVESGHSCAIDADDFARCWGSNDLRQLGTSPATDADGTPRRVAPASLTGVTDISAGGAHTCAVASGGAWCWGSESAGQIGTGGTGLSTGTNPPPRPGIPGSTYFYAAQPLAVSGLAAGVVDIEAGGATSCAVLESATVRCWGRNTSGELGIGTTTSSSVPVDVPGLSGVASISAGSQHVCALDVDGVVWCWGSNAWGQMGTPSLPNATAPFQVQGLPAEVVAIEAGDQHTCALSAAGEVSCWGRNTYRQLSGDTAIDVASGVVAVEGLPPDIASIDAGSDSTCAVTVDGDLWCWGNNLYGQLGVFIDALVAPGAVFSGAEVAAPPTISATRDPDANAAGWNAEPVTVSFTCSAASLASCTPPVTISADGADQTVTGTAVDAFGQAVSTTVGGISIDRSAPELAGVATTPPNEAGWYRAPATVGWSCSDGGSGVAPEACPADQITTGEGMAVTTAASVADRAGNVASASSEALQIDLTAPSTTVGPTPAWAAGDLTLELVGTDNLSGVATTTWSVDGGPEETGTQVVVSGQGTHEVAFRSVDVAGNQEPLQTVFVSIDVDAPSIVATLAPEPNAAGWNRSDVTVSYTCSDGGGSEVVSCSEPETFVGEVDVTAIGTVTDGAGNQASVSTPVRIDRTPPTITVNRPAPNASGWFNAPVEVSFSCSDTGGSGIGADCPAAEILSGEGRDQPVSAAGSDVAGNAASVVGDPVSIDLTAPTISGAATTAPNPGGGYLGPVTIEWTCGDALSGVASCPEPVTVSTEGVHVVSGSATDRAGTTATAEVTVRIDHDPSTDPGTATGIVTDSRSGAPIPGVLVRLHDATTRTAVLEISTGSDGRYTFPLVADGAYLVSATRWGSHLQRWHPAASSAAAAAPVVVQHGDVHHLDLEMDRGYELSGTIASRSGGTPVSGATVRVGPYVATSDATGRYSVTGMVPGSWSMTVTAGGFVSETSAVSISVDAVRDVALDPSPTSVGVKGTVVAASPAGRRLAGAVVRFYPVGAVNPAFTATTGTDGRYQLPLLPAGTYEVSVTRAYNRWLGNVAGRSNGSTLVVTTACADPSEASWGAPCAAVADFTLPTP